MKKKEKVKGDCKTCKNFDSKNGKCKAMLKEDDCGEAWIPKYSWWKKGE